MSEYRYTTNIGLPYITANVLLNKEFGLNLKPEYDSYKCDEYEIILDGDMAFIQFKELCIPFIRHTMDRMSNALGYDKYYWDVRDELEDKDIEEKEEEEEIVVEEEEEIVFEEEENYNILINIGHNLPDKSFLAYKFNTSIPVLAAINIVIYDKIKGFIKPFSN